MTSSSTKPASGVTLKKIPGELVQDGKHFVKISAENRNLVFISPDLFRGQVFVNVREYFIPQEEIETDNSEEEEEEKEEVDAVSTIPYLRPTKKGVCLNELEFNLMINKLNRVQTLIKRLKKRQKKVQFRLDFQKRGQETEKPDGSSRPKDSL